jgi:uncharacterized membrane protein YphA (DoxX/SURF4 family)
MLQPQTTLNGQVDAVDQVRWSLPTRIAFRLCFCYLLPCGMSCLFNYALSQSQFTPTPFWKSLSAHDPWQGILPWVCRHVFNVHKKIMIIPDADLLSGYLQRLFQLILSLVITAIWSLVDRKRLNYRTLYGWLTLYLRFALAIALFNYGWDKVFPLQFRAVTPLRLIRPIGDLSLEGMLWTFMAASNPYTIFSGTLEVLAGALLLVPRLEMLGALLSVAVLGNVGRAELCLRYQGQNVLDASLADLDISGCAGPSSHGGLAYTSARSFAHDSGSAIESDLDRARRSHRNGCPGHGPVHIELYDATRQIREAPGCVGCGADAAPPRCLGCGLIFSPIRRVAVPPHRKASAGIRDRPHRPLDIFELRYTQETENWAQRKCSRQRGFCPCSG